jgi:hypothetical protein
MIKIHKTNGDVLPFALAVLAYAVHLKMIAKRMLAGVARITEKTFGLKYDVEQVDRISGDIQEEAQQQAQQAQKSSQQAQKASEQAQQQASSQPENAQAQQDAQEAGQEASPNCLRSFDLFSVSNIDPVLGFTEGTSFHGHVIGADVKTMIDLLGDPVRTTDDSVDSKIQKEWVLVLDCGNVVTLYDWKSYRELSDNDWIDWHIGAHTPMIAMKAEHILQMAREIKPLGAGAVVFSQGGKTKVCSVTGKISEIAYADGLTEEEKIDEDYRATSWSSLEDFLGQEKKEEGPSCS